MQTKYNIIPDIIYEDNHLIVINKKSNLLTQGDYTKKKSLIEIIKEYIKDKYKKPGNVYLGMVQRLDKPVSGVIVFAKTSKAAKRLNEQFKMKKIHKFYIALTENNQSVNTSKQWTVLKNFIIRNKDITLITDKNNQNFQIAELKYKTILTSKNFSIQLIKLISGKKHQIRAQFANLNNPILGDIKYNAHLQYTKDAIALHAYSLGLTHPTLKADLKFIASLPENMQNIIKNEINLNKLFIKLEKEINLIINKNGQ